MAIKIMDVQSDSFLDYDKEGKTQDIILFTSTISLPGPLKHQVAIPRIVLGKWYELGPLLKALPTLTLAAISAFFRGRIPTPNILEEMYWSATPYCFGENKAIKWHTRPLKTITGTLPKSERQFFIR